MPSVKSKVVAAVAAAALALAAGAAKHFEGLYQKPYKDPVNITTVCYGHTGADIENRVYTKAECEKLLEEDLKEAERTVDTCITAELTSGQRAALIDFAFNVGPGKVGVKDGLCVLKSGAIPTIQRKFNAGDYAGGCAEFDKWNRQKLRGLERRRNAEEALCLS